MLYRPERNTRDRILMNHETAGVRIFAGSGPFEQTNLFYAAISGFKYKNIY